MRTLLVATLVLLAAAAPAPAQHAERPPKLSPYPVVRFTGDDLPHAMIDGRWCSLEAIDGHAVPDIIAYCKRRYGEGLWKKRFTEDLVEVLWGLGKPHDERTADLVVVDLETGQRRTLEDVPMTEENRRAVWEGPPKLSPYPAVRLGADGHPEVVLNGRWLRLESIDGRPVADILAYCRETYGHRWYERFTEDLVEVLWGLGKPIAERTVDLVATDLETAERRVFRDVLMTEENRWAIMAGTMQDRPGVAREHDGVHRVEREHAPGVPERFAPLVRRYLDDDGGPRLTAEQVGQDLDQLEWHLANEHSYTALGFRPGAGEFREALDAIRAAAGEGLSVADLAVQLQRVIASLGDGHAEVREFRSVLPAAYAPWLLADTAEGVVAFKEDRAGFIDEQRPLVRAIDGVPLERWIEAASRYQADGSPQLVRRRSIELLREIGFLRRVLGLPASDTVRIELTDTKGQDAAEAVLPLATRRPVYGAWPRTESRVLDGGITYIRIPEMDDDDDFIAEIVDGVRRAGPAGLILDVRDNGGGARDLVLALAPMLLQPGEAPIVVNAAVYRLRPGEEPDPEGHLDNRFLYPLTWPRWTEAQRAAIERFAAGFRPEIPPPEGPFSAWHYLVLDPGKADTPRYAGPVVVLMDEGCFSATDIFLAALGELPAVTLVGTPSSGGSGRSRSVRLAHSGLRVRLSSMVSYQPAGQLFEGRGVIPDIQVRRRAGDVISRGDAVLEAALAFLRERAGGPGQN